MNIELQIIVDNRNNRVIDNINRVIDVNINVIQFIDIVFNKKGCNFVHNAIIYSNHYRK